MKIIERPDSTTVVIELMFHRVKNVEEFKNIIADVDIKTELKHCGMLLDATTFQPMSFVWIDKGKPFFESLMYALPLEYAVEYNTPK